MRNKKIYAGLIVIMLIFLTGCKKSDGVIDVQPVKDPRTYTWTADTLYYPGNYQTLMTDIWGSSSKDVYAVGHSSSSDGVLWHFDGDKWKDVNLVAQKGGTIPGAFDLTAIYGFSGTDIYAVGSRIRTNPTPPPNFIDSSLLIHYDGSAWKQVNIISGSILRDIQGSSSTDIWAVGNFNTLYHYDGIKWARDSVAIDVPQNQAFYILSIGAGNSGTYLTGYTSFSDMSDLVTYFLKRVNSSWVKIDSSGFYGYKLFRSSSGSLYYAGQAGVFKNNGIQWSSIFSVNQYIVSMWASSDENIFAAGQGGQNKIYHYNGVDWKEIEQLSTPQADYWAVWTDGTEAFVVGHINDGVYQKTIVWHGK